MSTLSLNLSRWERLLLLITLAVAVLTLLLKQFGSEKVAAGIDPRLPLLFCAINLLAIVRPTALTHGLLVLGVGVVFIVAGALKVADPAGFAQNIKYYKLFPIWLIHFIAIVLPWWEIAAGVALIAPSWRRVGSFLIICMLMGFLGGLIRAAMLKLDISCGCFGKASGGAYQAILEDVAWLVGAVLLLLAPRSVAAKSDEPLAASPATAH